MVLFSIIVPIYNVEDYLKECLHSIALQSFQDFEVILVDDGSTDNSPYICDQFQRENNNIVVIHKTNGGLVSARKAGIKVAHGTYIVNIDGDDYVSDNLLLELYKIIKEFGCPDIIVYSYQAITISNKKLYIYREPHRRGLYTDTNLEKICHNLIYNIHNKNFYHNNGSISYNIWSKAIKKEILYDNQIQIDNSISLGEDIAVSVPCIVQCRSLFISHFVGYYYRQRKTSICHQFNKECILGVFKVINHLKEIDSVDLSPNIRSYGIRMIIGNLISAAKGLNSYRDFFDYYKLVMNYPEVQDAFCFKNKLTIYYSIIRFLVTNNHPLIFYILYHHLRHLFYPER